MVSVRHGNLNSPHPWPQISIPLGWHKWLGQETDLTKKYCSQISSIIWALWKSKLCKSKFLLHGVLLLGKDVFSLKLPLQLFSVRSIYRSLYLILYRHISGHMMGEWSSYDHAQCREELWHLRLLPVTFPFTLGIHSWLLASWRNTEQQIPSTFALSGSYTKADRHCIYYTCS